MGQFRVHHRYAARTVAYDGLDENSDWKLKRYSLSWDGSAMDDAGFAAGEAMALDALPSPAVDESRPGTGIVIRHQGRGENYVILAWWDRENELPIRVFVDNGEGWRPANEHESICVWDLQILAAERDAYVRHILAWPEKPDVRRYLAEIYAPGDGTTV